MTADRLSRRTFLRSSALGAAASGCSSAPALSEIPIPADVSRHWPGPELWANRTQDWRISAGRLECLADGRGEQIRTVFLLTREMIAGDGPAYLEAVVSKIGGGEGFCGFLLGGGGGKLDWRGSMILQQPSGDGGGLLACLETTGSLTFREHTDEENSSAYGVLADAAGPPLEDGEEVALQLEIQPAGDAFTLRLTAGATLGSVTLSGVSQDDLLGSVALVSSPAGPGGARFAFRDIKTGGPTLALRPERRVGPILGAMYSLNQTAESAWTLKLNAQLMPIGEDEPHQARLDYRQPDAAWTEGPSADIDRNGFTALFRLPDWDASRQWEYRVVYGDDSFEGILRRDPLERDDLRVAVYSCHMVYGRSTGPAPAQEHPRARRLGRYTSDGMYFPHTEVISNSSKHEPDLLVFTGDQIYEGAPTPKLPDPEPSLDYFYKWSLWLWPFREITRSTPCVVLVDDHDVYQGNIWGAGGRPAPGGDQNAGGYVRTPAYVNFVQRTQTAHNPDPYDPTPIEQGIGVYYGSFVYGGVSFALLEDRKFKTARPGLPDPLPPQLLGRRQEQFLQAWAADGRHPKIALTQTVYACASTQPDGSPSRDFDSNGYPKAQRDVAIRLLRDAKAVLLSGDQHLATLVHHGLEGYDDGIVQFSVPAAGTHFQRWFEPPALRDSGYTGRFTDYHGNRYTMLAVANPTISFADYREHIPSSNRLLDRRLKSDGYGIVRVDKPSRRVTLECWPWDADPLAGGEQYAGWPYQVQL